MLFKIICPELDIEMKHDIIDIISKSNQTDSAADIILPEVFNQFVHLKVKYIKEYHFQS